MRRRQNGRRKAARSFFLCFARLFDLLTFEKERERVFDDEVLLLFQKRGGWKKSLSTPRKKKHDKKRKETVFCERRLFLLY